MPRVQRNTGVTLPLLIIAYYLGRRSALKDVTHYFNQLMREVEKRPQPRKGWPGPHHYNG